MKRIFLQISTFLCLAVLLTVPATIAAAQNLVPCCEGGGQPNKKCNTDQNCKGVCLGGARDGKICRDDSKCPAACIGGDRDGFSCNDDADCPAGTCGSAGNCDEGTCTALCQTGKPPKTESEPASGWLELDDAVAASRLSVCP